MSPLRLLLTLMVFTTLTACATSGDALRYPDTAREAQVDHYFGTAVADPYRWLEDANAARTRQWVSDQNALTHTVLARIPFRDALLQRIRALADYPRFGLPFRRHGQVFFYKNNGLQNQAVLYVQQGLHGTPEVLLDPNTFSSDGTVQLDAFTPSADGQHAVISKTAIPGSDWRELSVMDLRTRQMLPDTLKWVRFSSTAWRGNGFYYSRYPQPAAGTELSAPTLHQAVYYHRLGTAQEADTLVYADAAHPDHFVSVSTTEDERFALLAVRDPGRRGNSLWVRDDRAGETTFRPVVADISEDSYDVVDNEGEQLLVLTNAQAPNRKLLRFDPRHGRWTTVLPERAEVLEQVSAAGGRLFASYLRDVASHVEVHARDGSLQQVIELPGPGTASGFGGDANDPDVFYAFTSLSQPPSIFRYDLATQRSELFRSPDIAGFDATRFESRQVFFHSRDGTRVPMFLVYRKGLALDGRRPTILYGYGGFNVTLQPSFSAVRVAWLEQGGVFAMANLRGGGEYGEAWHEAGMRLNKQNVFDDCIAAAEYLIREGYSAPDRMVLQGGSNGGLLVGAVINQRPDLFRVALPQVGVMDMLRFQKFSVGAAWVADYGSSDDPVQFANLYRFSPLHNIRSELAYPAVLVTTSDHDDRVVPAHSFKYIATLQALAGAGAPKLIRIETRSGHGASNLGKALEESADTMSFAWSQMGFTPSFPPVAP